MAAILRLTITADIKGHCPIGHLRHLWYLTLDLLDIHVMVNWHLSKQGIRWPVSRDHIAGSSWELIGVSCFFQVDRWQGTGFQLDRRLKPTKTRLHFSRAQLRLDAASTSSSKHFYSWRYSCLGGKRFWKKPLFPCIFGGFNRKQVGHHGLTGLREKRSCGLARF